MWSRAMVTVLGGFLLVWYFYSEFEDYRILVGGWSFVAILALGVYALKD